MPKVVAIHQPNFFPWLAYFHKIARADVFVFLDEVDYPKSGKSMGSYTNRVKLNIGGTAKWWGCPVVRESGPQPICSVVIRDEPWAEKALRTLRQSYARAAHASELMDAVEEMVRLDVSGISAYNIANLRRVAELLGLRPRWVLQSELGTRNASTELLVEIVRAVGGTTYFSGTGGALEYQQETLFEEAGIDLLYSDFSQTPYEQVQTDGFISGLSVIDALLNTGIEHTARLVRGG